MIDAVKLVDQLHAAGLAAWLPLLPTIEQRLSPEAHGDLPRWGQALDALRAANSDADRERSALLELSPWRKGPFQLGATTIDAEWRSDLKWQRVAGKIDLAGHKVLDVGCGNGYYALEMRKIGAATVFGIDPTLLYVMQFLAVNHFVQDAHTSVLPLRMHELPPGGNFDSVFSMGVLYHQRSPIDHLRQLRGVLRRGGQLVLETIYLPGDGAFARTPEDRYARMKNVWLLPSLAELTTWLRRSGFRDIDVIDESVTTTDEQRSTEWMTFESLAEALDPDDATKTVEGWPAPHRVVVKARKP